MNPVIKTIHARRSIRQYDSKPLTQEIVQTLLEAGNQAPSGANGQPWRFVVIEEAGLRKKFAQAALPRYQEWISKAPEGLKALRASIDSRTADPAYYEAPVIVFVLGKGNTADLDCAMACQNIMLAARSLEIGSCWSFFGQLALTDPELRKHLEMQEGEKVYGPILLGYPKEGFPEKVTKRPAQVKWL
jgi:nitroreductase